MKNYQITRDMFFSNSQTNLLLKTCQQMTKGQTDRVTRIWRVRYMLALLALRSGLRVSEIAALSIGDLFLEGNKEHYLIVQRGKGGKRRDVYLDDKLTREIRKFIKQKEKWGESTSLSSPLFAGRAGKNYTTTALHISFKEILKTAGLPKQYSIHSCRHTYATMILAKSCNLRFVQKQLGHASINMTAHYADVLPELNQALANTILN
jgi:site-specific recombinase XerD